MNKNILRSLITATALSVAMIGTASADQIWDFGSLNSGHENTQLGANITYNQNGQSLTATALIPGWTQSPCSSTKGAPCLFAKFTSGDPAETGLGLEPNVDNEIFYPNGIGLTSSNQITSIEIGSVQTNESWDLLGCAAGFMSCTTIDSGIGSGGMSSILTFTSLGSFASYIVYVPCANNSTTCSVGSGHTNQDNNIVLVDATTMVVPEPGTLALFGAGLLGCAIFVGRRRRSTQTRA